MQYAFFDARVERDVVPITTFRHEPFKQQLLKWVGNKQRFAHEIADFFPATAGTYFEPFLGSAAVLGTYAPPRAIGSDIFAPLIGIWQALKDNPDALVGWYGKRLTMRAQMGKQVAYDTVLASYNSHPNPADFVYLSRACYGGVVRFRRDGYMSTPCGPHEPVPLVSFEKRVRVWRERVEGARFERLDYQEAMSHAKAGDIVYCDPPYTHTQAILYGAQSFNLAQLMAAIADCKSRGVHVILSIDGTKKSGSVFCDIRIPDGLFEREIAVNVGRSMLRRFQLSGETLEHEVVHDRLLLTY
ncbi:Dam family site-specific DNA-(adenine-N6)-methyltransferase [Methylobacterium sp. 88A]|uniref:Dam family site-specific DNA-(adenine-N6)-methyltransferase n=1 Tax=Methylobacterium sp. 88A TaxID=1131813 RepID=UPI00035CE24E|nr:Dam family site-specific DNA-(adenine-N6)-methyltransferase [Methylobacterium sp. 88A]